MKDARNDREANRQLAEWAEMAEPVEWAPPQEEPKSSASSLFWAAVWLVVAAAAFALLLAPAVLD